MSTLHIHPLTEPSRARRLKDVTHEAHERLDSAIMSMASFTTLDGYRGFLRVQYLFHRDIDALYRDAGLGVALPGVAARNRFGLIEADMADLGMTPPDAVGAPFFAKGIAPDLPTALGWLYVAEGSNMGAALLRKEAAKIGLSDEFGARHLAPADEGPAPHWRAFVAALDAVPLTEEGEAQALVGARDAFALVQAHVDACFG